MSVDEDHKSQLSMRLTRIDRASTKFYNLTRLRVPLSEHLRRIICLLFRIVYWHDKNKVRIVRIWQSERLLRMPSD